MTDPAGARRTDGLAMNLLYCLLFDSGPLPGGTIAAARCE